MSGIRWESPPQRMPCFLGNAKGDLASIGVNLLATRAPDVAATNSNAHRTVTPVQDRYQLSKSALKPMSMFIKITPSQGTPHIAWRLLLD